MAYNFWPELQPVMRMSNRKVPVFVAIKCGIDTCFKMAILKRARHFLVHMDVKIRKWGKKVFFCTWLLEVTKLTVEHMIRSMTRNVTALRVCPCQMYPKCIEGLKCAEKIFM